MSLTEGNHSNPLLAVDVIIRKNRKIVLIERDNAPEGWAIPGGFVEVNETVEEAARREIKEETDLRLRDLRQWHVYSDPERDPRQHVVSTCFTATGSGSFNADSDARRVKLFSVHEDWPKLVFDHKRILNDYRLAGTSPGTNFLSRGSP